MVALPNRLKMFAAAATGLAAIGLATAPVLAGEQIASIPAHCTQDHSQASISVQAGIHSECTREVSVVVSGNSKSTEGEIIPGAFIGQHIVKAFAGKGIKAKYFLDLTDNYNGAAVSYWVKGVTVGKTLPSHRWTENAKKAVALHPLAWASNDRS